ncbi:MAG: spore coat protein [Firmicutes bacterium]|nr:spore coat protein [Bacillota bacterium]
MPYRQQISPVSISIDCLNSTKYLVLRDAVDAVKTASPQLKQVYSRMTQEHLAMQDEWFRLMNSRGWYQVAPAQPNTITQTINQIQTVISQTQGTAGQAGAQQFQQTPGYIGQYR